MSRSTIALRWTAVAFASAAACTRADSADQASGVASSAPVPPPPGASAPPTDDAGTGDASTPLPPWDAGGNRTPAKRIDWDGGMDPALSIPGVSSFIGAYWNCQVPGSQTGCLSPESCRISSPDSGRCEGCTTCSPAGTTCDASTDCAIFLQCYAGKCTNICPLDKPGACLTECLDVGNMSFGVCRLP
jgi:hypothetical protein